MPSITAIVASVATLATAGLVAMALAVTSDVFRLSGRTIASVLVLVLLVVPVAILLAWNEVDLSIIGTFTLGGYVYVEQNESGAAVAIVAAALVTTLVGLLIGLFRSGFASRRLWCPSARERPSPASPQGSGFVAALAGTAAAVIVGVVRLAMDDFTDIGVALGALLLITLVLGHAIPRVVRIGSESAPARPIELLSSFLVISFLFVVASRYERAGGGGQR